MAQYVRSAKGQDEGVGEGEKEGGDSGAGSGRMRSRGGERTDQTEMHQRGSHGHVLEGGLDVPGGKGPEMGLTTGMRLSSLGAKKVRCCPEGFKKQGMGQKAWSGKSLLVALICPTCVVAPPFRGWSLIPLSLNLVTCFPAMVAEPGTVCDIRDEVTKCSAASSLDSGASHSGDARHHVVRTHAALCLQLRPEMS